MKFVYTRLLVDQADFDACRDFYKNILGFKVKWGETDPSYTSFDTGETTISLNAYWIVADALGLVANPPKSDRAALIFEVEDVDAKYEALKAQGVIFIHTPTDHTDWGIRAAHFRDPAGNLIEINKPLAH